MAEQPSRRIFTFEEARRLLPAVREQTRHAVEKMGSVEVGLGHEDADADEAESPDAKLEEAAREILGKWAEEIRAMGIDVKGPWLVDFDSGAGYYCWKWPEESLEFFHGYEEGFAGRVRLQ